MLVTPAIDLLTAAVGILLLYLGGSLLVERAKTLALGLGVPLAVVGATVVALGTSFPEVVVSTLAAAGGSPGLALGNVLGSNLANIGLVIGLAAVIRPLSGLAWGRADGLAFVLSPLLLVAMALDGVVSRTDGVILLLGAVAYFAAAGGAARPTGLRGFFGAGAEARLARRQMAFAVLGLAVGAALLFAGGHALVVAASALARAVGVGELVIGLTVVAVGTSLPEIVTSVTAARRGSHDLATANATGSNIINLLVVLGLAAFVHPIAVPVSARMLDLPLVVAATAFIVIWIAYRPKLGRVAGAGLLVFYAAYLVAQVWRT